MSERDKLARSSAHAFLVTRLKRMTWQMTRLYGFDYAPPTCLKCGEGIGILSKLSEPSKLICLKCGTKYELKTVETTES